MKALIIFLFTCIAFKSLSQDTLIHYAHGIGYERYLLYEDGTFSYQSQLCMNTFISYGNYKKSLFGYKFDYDTTKCPTSSLICSDSTSNLDSITFIFYSIIDSSHLPFYGTIKIGEQNLRDRFDVEDLDTLKILRADVVSNKVEIKQSMQELDFKFDINSTVNHIYIEPYGFGHSCGTNDIQKLKRTKHGYLHRFHVYDEVPEKPWKRQKRKVYHYYQLFEQK